MKRIISLLLSIVMLVGFAGCKSNDYKNAQILLQNKQFDEAVSAFEQLGDYKDSIELISESKFQKAVDLSDEGNLKEAEEQLKALNDYAPAKEKLVEVQNKLYKTLPEYLAEGVLTSDFLKAYGLSNQDVKYYAYPQTIEEIHSSFLYSYIMGEYMFADDERQFIGKYTLDNFKDYIYLHDSLFDIFVNLNTKVFCCEDGFYITLDGGASPLTPKEISNTLIESYIEAKKIYDDIHAQGIIVDSMNDVAVAKAYSKYLMQHIPSEKHPSWFTLTADNFDPKDRTQSMLSDGAYNVLINHWGECAPHAAVFDIFMNMEGIKCVSSHCHVNGAPEYDGHLVSVFCADDTLYMCDWFNKEGVKTIKAYSKQAKMLQESMDNAKRYFGLSDTNYTFGWIRFLNNQFINELDREHSSGITEPDEPGLPSIYWEYTGREGNEDKYLIKLADTNKLSLDDNTPLYLMYHSEYHGHNIPCTFGQLKQGLVVAIGDYIDQEFAKDGEYFVCFMIRKP